ncbi:MAG: PA14 domain-containing protein, partial [Lentisphaerales bacterium]|nr:PA14 domain-containing protein [Lentisphaerales bacterium]
MRNSRFFTLVLLFIIAASSAHASWYSDGTQKGSDIIMKETRYPIWVRGWYNAFWNGRFYPQGGRYYGGFANYAPDDIKKSLAYKPEMVWTFWGSPAYKGHLLENIYIPPQGVEYKAKHGLEGSKGGATGRPQFMKPNTWFNTLMRTWPSENDPDVTYVGQWVKDMDSKEWHTLGVFQIPCRVTGFNGNAEFAEQIGNKGANRVFERRNGYCRVDGKWHHMNTMNVRGNNHVKLTAKENVIRFESHGRKEAFSGPGANMISIPKQGDPKLDQPFIQSAHAKAYNDQVVVNWQIPRTAAPQRAYRLTAYSEANGKGKVIADFVQAYPHVRQASINAKGAQSVKLTVTDIFDQQVSKAISIGSLSPQKALSAKVERRSGVQYRFYEAPRKTKWTELPDFKSLKLNKSGLIRDIDDSIRESKGSQYAIQFDGFIDVPEDGVYLFEYRMAGVSKLSIDGKVVIDSKGTVTRTPLRQTVALKKGIHAFHLETLKVDGVRKGGNSIEIRWAGRDGKLKPLSTADLSCAPKEALPKISLKAESLSHVKRITPAIELNGKEVRKVEFYSGLKLIRAIYPKNNSPLSIDLLIPQEGVKLTSSELNLGILLPQGENKIHARLWTTDNRSIFTNIITLQGAKKNLASPWKLKTNVSSTSITGVQATKDSIAIIGEGENFVYQPVKGDFTITARIARSPRRGRDNNNGYGHSSRFGLEISGPGTQNFSLYQLGKGGVKVFTDAANFDGWNVSYWKMPKNEYAWFRISKEGNLASSFVSDDGKTWECVNKRVGIFGKDVHVGMTYITKPGDTALYHATIDQIKIEPGAFYVPRIFPTKKEVDTKRRISAIIQSHSQPNILLARTTHAGVLKSTDHGKSWKAINRGVSKTLAATRSIAIHP